MTRNRIAEHAGVSIGSLDRDFPNAQAVLSAICDADTGRVVAGLHSAETLSIDAASLADALYRIVEFQLERHRRLHALGPDFNRATTANSRSNRARMGSHVLEVWMLELIERHRDGVHVRDRTQAAVMLARGISAIVRRALDERPTKLSEPAFRHQLIDLLTCYLTAERTPRQPRHDRDRSRDKAARRQSGTRSGLQRVVRVFSARAFRRLH